MKAIPTSDLNNTTLAEIFKEIGLKTEVVILYSTDASLDIEEDSYVKVFYPESKEVISWIRKKEGLLRMRTILLNREQVNLLKKQEKQTGLEVNWDEKMAFLNQNAGVFGAINVNIHGLTLDYSMPFSAEILPESIQLSGNNLIRGSKYAWTHFEIIIKRLYRKLDQNH